MNKLPQITLAFWVMKICATTLGETAGDLLSMTLDVGYALSSLILLGAFLATLLAQLRSERYNPWLYWVAILCSNTLGTALGDFLADDSGLGFAGGALLIGGLLALVSLAHWFTRISGVLLFWIAFVLTRPFGATLGDVLTKPHEKGGLDFGTVGSSLVLLSILALFVAYAAYDGSRSSDRVGATS
ncbi:hypothetical protein I5I99_08880 [Pseudomonas aeruginosa]|nr:hypothetical protein [Pseudomonas aeruginosa]